MTQTESGLAGIGKAQIYYELTGAGEPFVMIHAGVADSRQWNNEFASFSEDFRVLRYDMRGYGRSEPVEGDFTHLQDLTALLEYLGIRQLPILMGCSIGGGLAMDFALTQPAGAKALIMVSSGPGGLELDVPEPGLFAEAETAYNAGDLDRVAEIETRIWFDGMDRSSEQVNQEMRRLTYEMNRKALTHDAKGLGKGLPNTPIPAADRMAELEIPILAVVGAQDIPYILAAADHMVGNIRSARKVILQDAAHLCNLDQPDAFQRNVREFLDGLAQ